MPLGLSIIGLPSISECHINSKQKSHVLLMCKMFTINSFQGDAWHQNFHYYLAELSKFFLQAKQNMQSLCQHKIICLAVQENQAPITRMFSHVPRCSIQLCTPQLNKGRRAADCMLTSGTITEEPIRSSHRVIQIALQRIKLVSIKFESDPKL